MRTPIREFRGEFRFLSNFWPSPVPWRDVTFPSVEHAFQASKTTDADWIARIAAAATPGDAKRLGRQAPLRPDWEQVKVKVMAALLKRKFTDPALRAKLLATGDAALIEGNTWGDIFWGVDLRTGAGQNNLGQLLMTLRQMLVTQADKPKTPTLTKIISGGQTGADQAGLFTAEAFGIATGGWAPRGWLTSRGPAPALLRDRFKLVEHEGSYASRTYANVHASDGTIRLALDFTTAGEQCTLRAIQQYGRPHFDVDLRNPRPVAEAVAWIREQNIHVLNIAGNREHPKTPGVFKAACFYLRDILIALDYQRIPRAA